MVVKQKVNSVCFRIIQNLYKSTRYKKLASKNVPPAKSIVFFSLHFTRITIYIFVVQISSVKHLCQPKFPLLLALESDVEHYLLFDFLETHFLEIGSEQVMELKLTLS